MNREHPCAKPEEERLEEPDKTPMEELSDPLRRAHASTVAGDRQLRGEQARTTRAASRRSPTAARAVGECLDCDPREQSIAGRQAVTGRGSVHNACGQGLSITYGEGRALTDPAPGTRYRAATRTTTTDDPVSYRGRARMLVSSRLVEPSGRACPRPRQVSGARSARTVAILPAVILDQT